MRTYELVLVLQASMSEAEQKKLLETIKKWLGEAQIKNINEWGKKTFVRPIKKLNEGFYLMLQITTESVIPADIEKRLLMENKILRHLLVRK